MFCSCSDAFPKKLDKGVDGWGGNYPFLGGFFDFFFAKPLSVCVENAGQSI